MKKMILVLSLVSMVSASHASAYGSDQPRVQTLKPSEVFTPKGFDSNDNAQIVVAGALSGYCMKLGAVQHKVDIANKRIYINQSVSITGNCSDLAMYIPYSTVINLGALPAGNYDIGALDTNGQYAKMSTLPISPAKTQSSNTTDERLYAPVANLKFDMNPTMSAPVITISGVLTNSCLSLGNIEARPTANNILEVLPIVKVARENCKMTTAPFSKSIALPGFPSIDTLIHVRAMGGQSINKVITQLDRL